MDRDHGDEAAEAFGEFMGAMKGAAAQMMGLAPLEYVRVPWEAVNEHAAEGWRMLATPPVLVKRRGQDKLPVLLYVMERPVLSVDAALAAVMGAGNG